MDYNNVINVFPARAQCTSVEKFRARAKKFIYSII